MGDKGFETLKKTVYRKDSDSSLGPLDLYMPLMVLPRTILSWLVQNIKPMKVNDTKQVPFPGNSEIIIHVQKTGRDSYRAEFVEGGRIIHEFDKQTLPLIGGHLMTIGEMYDDIATDEEPEEYADLVDEPKKTLAGAMCDMAQVPQIGHDDSEKFKWAMAHENVKALTGVIGKLVDAFVSNQVFKENVAKIIDKPKKDDLEVEKDHDIKEYEDMGKEEVKENLKKPKADLDKLEPPGAAASPKQPLQPQGAAAAVKPNKDPIAAQRKQGQAAFKEKFGKLASPKKPTSNYFKDKLKKPIQKNEFHVSESELYTPCYHCNVAEFVKHEEGPKYMPCACYVVTLKNENNKKISFVQVIKKKEGGFTLNFNKQADTDIVYAFLKTLRSRFT